VRRFVLFILGLLFLANLVCWFSVNALLDRLAVPEITHGILGVFVVVQVIGLLAMIIAHSLGYQPGTGLGRPLLSLLMIWNMLLALPTAAVSLLGLTIWWVATGGSAEADPTSAGRVIGLLAVAMPFVAAFFATAIATWQLNRFRVRRMTLEIPNLPPALQGFTIAHLSDLHIGKLTRGKVLEDMAAETNRFSAHRGPDQFLAGGPAPGPRNPAQNESALRPLLVRGKS
jgi:uncharacterized protein